MKTKLFIVLSLICHICIAENSSASNETSDSTESIESDEININGRIIGGTSAGPGQFPYVARLIICFRNSRNLCTGTVLSERIILTAAHCVYGQGEKAVYAIAQIDYKEIVVFTSSELYPHPGYADNFADDIAILKLQGNRQPIKAYGNAPSLPTGAAVKGLFSRANAIVAGWGKTSDNSLTGSSTLQYAAVNTIPNNWCRQAYGRIITSKVMCTLNQGKGICGGDSGGPLMINRYGKTYVVGVNAFGSSVCESYAPSGYTYVYAYMDWLSSIIN